MQIEKYTDRLKTLVQSAQDLALRSGHQQITPLHVLKELLDDEDRLAANLIEASGGRAALVGQDVEREVRTHFPDLVFDTVIPRNGRVGEAPSHGLPVTHHDPHSAGAEAYFQLAKEVAARG